MVPGINAIMGPTGGGKTTCVFLMFIIHCTVKTHLFTVTCNMLNDRNDIHFCHFNTKGKICVFAVCAVY